MWVRTKNYEERLAIPIAGDDVTDFFTKIGHFVAHGYCRVVIGERGPYVEFDCSQMNFNLTMRECETKRLTSNIYYYDEYRTPDEADVKIYHQKKTVAYADYRVGYFYISPFELFLTGDIPIITPLRKKGVF